MFTWIFDECREDQILAAMERTVLTGITRTTASKYMTQFGFTENEVDQALELFDLSDRKEEVSYSNF